MTNLDPKRRVVVTGLGVVSSIGIGWQEFWPNLLAGKSGISRLEAIDTSGHDRHFAGEIKLNFSNYLSSRNLKKLGRTSQIALVAAKLALKDAKLDILENIDRKIMVSVGTTAWEMGVLENLDDKFFLQNNRDDYQKRMIVMPGNTLSACIAEELKLSGPNHVFGTACSSGNYAIGLGFDYIRSGKIDYALVGGADAISRVVFTGFNKLHAVAEEKCQPFDRDRKGMIPGEGGGMLFLETLESALKRKAHIYSEISGYGLSCDGHHMTNPDSLGVSKAIRKSLLNSNINPNDVDYISAHGTGTVENDKAESEAYHRVFNSYARKIPISSIKSMLGHTMGAAAALESIACCLAIENDEIPPTINFENSDPTCDIDCVPNFSRKHRVNIALNNSQAFGGNNYCVVYS